MIALVARAPLLADLDQQHVGIAIDVDRLDDLDVSGGLSLVPRRLPRPRVKMGLAASSVFRKAASSIHAIISTSPVSASCTMAGIRPSGFHFRAVNSGSGSSLDRTFFAREGTTTLEALSIVRLSLTRCPSRLQ